MSNQSKMKPFPFLTAPALVQKAIIEMLALPERVNLSFASNRTLFLISCFTSKHLKIAVDDNIGFHKNQATSVSLNVDDNEIRILWSCPKKNVSLTNVQPVGLIAALTELHQCVDRFDKVVFGEQDGIVPLTGEELTYVLENVTADFLHINNNNQYENKNYIYRKSHKNELNIRKLRLENVIFLHFVDLPSVRNIEVKYSNFMSGVPHLVNMNTFLEFWIEGRGNQIVEKIHFDINYCKVSWILSGVNTEPTQLTDAELNEMRFPRGSIAVDIVRESDGLRATVIIRDRDVTMMAWTEENLRAIGRNN